jgi:hypothetical protein
MIFDLNINNMRIKFIITLVIFIALGKSICAQTVSDPFFDTRIKSLLDSKNISYSITQNGNFSINLITEESPKKRTQRILIYSKKASYFDFEILNIESFAFTIPKKNVKTSLFIDLLKKNGTIKIGAWSVYEYDSDPDNYSFSFEVKVGYNISAEDLYSLINIVGLQADDKEKLWGNGLDEN